MNSTTNILTPQESTNYTDPLSWPLGSIEKCAFTVYTLFGLPTHFYIIWLIVTGTGSGVTSEFFILNLSVCEISYCLNCLLTLLSDVYQSLLIITRCLLGLGIAGRPVFQSLICVERYLAVVHPVTFLKSKPLRHRLICCSAAWIFTLSCCFCYMVNLASNNYIVFTWFFSVLFLVFFFIQLFCLVAVLRALKQSGPGDRRREEDNHMKRRAFFLILITTVSMTITFVPLIFSGFISISIQSNIEIHRNVGLACFVVGGFVQPVLYLHRTGKLSHHLCSS